MNKNNQGTKLLLTLLLALTLLSFCLMITTLPLDSKGQVTPEPTFDVNQFMDSNSGLIVGVVIAAAIIAIIVIFKKYSILIFSILIFIALLGVFLFGNSSDGQVNVNVVRVVQPSGDNPSIDSTYSQINRENATTNLINGGALLVYGIVGLVGALVFAAITIKLKGGG